MSKEQAALEDPNMPPDVPEEPVAEPSSEASAPSETPEESEQDKVQQRINKITAEKYAEKRRADALEQELVTARGSTPQPITAAPKLEDFEYDEGKYQEALIDFKVNQKAIEIQEGQQAAVNQQASAQSQVKFNQGVAKLMETATDWQEVADRVPLLPQETLDTVMRSDNGPELVYYLGQNPDVAEQISTANPMDAAVRLGQITALLGKPKIKPSAAPEPIEPVNSGGTVGKDLENMSMEEIYKS